MILSAFLLSGTLVLAASTPAPLPDPLVLANGHRVTSTADWFDHRVPELRELFQHDEYGRQPPTEAISVHPLAPDAPGLKGKAVLRQVQIACGKASPITLLVILPTHHPRKVPCFLCLHNGPNIEVLSDPVLLLPPNTAAADRPGLEAKRGIDEKSWNLAATVARGYAVAIFYPGDLVPDHSDPAEAALQRWHPGAAQRAGDETATLMAWAWGASRVYDYLATVRQIDPRRIAVMGHSRAGKAALVAGAFDQRFALVLPSQSGTGGAAPCRQPPVVVPYKLPFQSVANINHQFPWWFAVNFRAYDDDPAQLPIDQHELIALCAPRPVLISCARGDIGTNAQGQFDMLRAADPVYRLIAGHGLAVAQMPAVGQLVSSRLGYFIRPGKHSVTPEDWAAWLDYADKWL